MTAQEEGDVDESVTGEVDAKVEEAAAVVTGDEQAGVTDVIEQTPQKVEEEDAT